MIDDWDTINLIKNWTEKRSTKSINPTPENSG